MNYPALIPHKSRKKNHMTVGFSKMERGFLVIDGVKSHAFDDADSAIKALESAARECEPPADIAKEMDEVEPADGDSASKTWLTFAKRLLPSMAPNLMGGHGRTSAIEFRRLDTGFNVTIPDRSGMGGYSNGKSMVFGETSLDAAIDLLKKEAVKIISE